MKSRRMKALLLAGAMMAALLTAPTQAVETQSPQTDGFLTNGEPTTEENVLELLRQLEAECKRQIECKRATTKLRDEFSGGPFN